MVTPDENQNEFALVGNDRHQLDQGTGIDPEEL